jgi:hypothetical protein
MRIDSNVRNQTRTKLDKCGYKRTGADTRGSTRIAAVPEFKKWLVTSKATPPSKITLAVLPFKLLIRKTWNICVEAI